ncbi:MAG: LTA synthase family protein [Lachnospiraceae bacterium]|nr:LTA synthase family protein [Lachnospiraceae bacterium]
MNEKKSIFIWNKKRAAAAIVATAAILILTAFTAYGSGMDTLGMTLGVLLGIAAGVFVLLNIRFGKILSAVLYLLLPLAVVCALENYTHVITDLAPLILVLNLLFFYVLYGLLAALTGSVSMGFKLATLVPMLFGLTNYFVVSFRGSPIVPWDLLSLGTAASVADNYEFVLSWKAFYSILAFIWMILLSSKSTVKLGRKKLRVISIAAYAALMCLYVGEIQNSAVQSFFGMDTTLFTLNVLYRNNGIAAAFLGNLRFLNIEQPSGYSVDKVEELMQRVEASAKDEPETDAQVGTNAAQTETAVTADQSETQQTESSASATVDNTKTAATEQYPNIVVIMDEAFSDLSVWGDFATSEEVMPFFKSLQQEAVGGEVYVSVKGGNTANTEFEFLTGDTMGFLPKGSVPYQQYITDETPSLASYLKTLGYSATAIHPYNRTGWDRDTVYEKFGFDEFLDKDSFSSPYRLRGYISDKSAFDKIKEQFSIKGDDERKFIFEVTMQNHGGYSRETPDFNIYLTLPEVTNKTTSVVATEKYLTLMNQTDRALEELIDYFKEQEEPVIVVMFGDHQPSDYITNVIQRICGVTTSDSLADLEQGYRVPFMMWSNYGLEHKYYDGISVNYLSSILMENAGIPLTGYQTFLKNLMETLPVINANVYRDADGNFYNYEDDAYSEELNDYQMLQYNHLVDKKHRDSTFFGS